MTEDKKPDFKKGFSGGFFWFLLAAFFMAWMVQSFIDTKQANVAFSYQLEHLVNLQLIKPEDSRKTAINDNLVTFSGNFRDKLTEEGKKRYKYLELLEANHKLTNAKEETRQDLILFNGRVREAAETFLSLSGIEVPPNGYIVVDDISAPENSVVIREAVRRVGVDFPELQGQLKAVSTDATEKNVQQFASNLVSLIRGFRSSALGIGTEGLKQTLRGIDQEVQNLRDSSTSPVMRLVIYEKALDELGGVIRELNKTDEVARLSQLRSVRNYTETLEKYQKLSKELEENEVQLDKAKQAVSNVIWFFNNKELSTKALERQDPEQFNQWFISAKEEWQEFPKNKGGYFKAPDQPLNKVLEKTFKSEEPAPNYASYLVTFLPVLLVVLVLYFIFSRQMRGMGSGAMNFGKSPAKLLQKGAHKVTFNDVAGVDEALEELQEIVEFLRSPKKFTALGGHIPKGVLCIGPPGTGKTLIARAVAGEADRPFFSISGSDFVEMFVGVGASRIRDMFEQAKKNAPCIVFIDEIDAVGRHRGAGVGGGHDEREQTLNQLLVEMDGFAINEGVILIAATNRPDVLDKALLRPGRFDRRVVIDLPDIKGRFQILKVHAKKIKMDPSVNLMNIARSTPGASGADLENILNEAALLAARKEKTAVTAVDVAEARDKVLFGKERRSLEMDDNDKLTTAYHESGHTVVSLAVDHADPVDKVTIIPRGFSLGATMFLPEKNRNSYWRKELIDRLAVLMGGRCAEEIFVHDVSSGAQHDFVQATNLARSMVCEWGMSDKLGPVTYSERSESGQHLGMMNFQEKNYSEDTARAIDAEVKTILEAAHNHAKTIILKYKDQVELMTRMLMEFETLDSVDIKEIWDHEWDVEKKKKRLKEEEEKHKKEMKPRKKQHVQAPEGFTPAKSADEPPPYPTS